MYGILRNQIFFLTIKIILIWMASGAYFEAQWVKGVCFGVNQI